jgi:hypothetical protein
VLNNEKELSDRAGRVAITVPRTWSSTDDPDAGQQVEQGFDSYTIPDLDVYGFTGAVAVFVEKRADTSAAEAHEIAVDAECEVMGCISRGTPTKITVSGRTGTEQVLQHPEDGFTRVLTVAADALVITVLGRSTGPSDTVTEVVRSVVIHR